ncbi:MAG: ABC transporter ATP-binding protein [Phycisphaerae bacterium]|nr:ABC transporter ATP-binding protein [Phycisphaerae bacterium]
MSEPVVHLENVAFRRKTKQILHDVSWRIEKGTQWTLLGANGSGKTTLLKIITGYEWPSSGSVHVLGRHFGECSISELRTLIGWVSSAIEVQLPPHDTALEIVVSGLAASIGLYREFSEDELSAARTALSQVAADLDGDRPFGVLSQGEQQRVLIARAIVCRPTLLILDEPCLGLDPAARQGLLNDLARLAAWPDCPTIIYVTHHIEEIGPWITGAMLLKGGRCVGQGPPEEMITSERMSDVFSADCRVVRAGGGFGMYVEG